MRDIRADLRERMELLAREKQFKEAEIMAIERKIAMLEGLLEQEEQNANPVAQTALAFVGNRPRRANAERYSSPLALAVLYVFKTTNPATLEQFKAQAIKDKVEFGGKHPGRMIHFLLLGMEQNGIVRRMDDGKWRLIKDIFGGENEAVA